MNSGKKRQSSQEEECLDGARRHTSYLHLALFYLDENVGDMIRLCFSYDFPFLANVRQLDSVK